jgi:hypothetical protein
MFNIVEGLPRIVKETGNERPGKIAPWRKLSHMYLMYGILLEKLSGDGRLRLDPGCPLELVGVDLTHDARGVRGFVRLFNLSDRLVTGFEAVISWQTDGESTGIPLRSGPIAAPPHEPFVLPLEAEAAPGGKWSGLFFVQVDMEGAPPWKGSPKRLIEVEMPERPSPRELEALRRVAGPDAAVRPHFEKDYWICACGRVNSEKSPGCDRCGRPRRECKTIACQLVAAFGSELPGENPPQRKKPAAGQAQPDTAFHQDLRRRYLRQKSMLIRRTVTMLTTAALIGLIALMWTWLLGMQQRAKDIVPPTRIDAAQEAVPPGGASALPG